MSDVKKVKKGLGDRFLKPFDEVSQKKERLESFSTMVQIIILIALLVFFAVYDSRERIISQKIEKLNDDDKVIKLPEMYFCLDSNDYGQKFLLAPYIEKFGNDQATLCKGKNSDDPCDTADFIKQNKSCISIAADNTWSLKNKAQYYRMIIYHQPGNLTTNARRNAQRSMMESPAALKEMDVYERAAYGSDSEAGGTASNTDNTDNTDNTNGGATGEDTNTHYASGSGNVEYPNEDDCPHGHYCPYLGVRLGLYSLLDFSYVTESNRPFNPSSTSYISLEAVNYIQLTSSIFVDSKGVKNHDWNPAITTTPFGEADREYLRASSGGLLTATVVIIRVDPVQVSTFQETTGGVVKRVITDWVGYIGTVGTLTSIIFGLIITNIIFKKEDAIDHKTREAVLHLVDSHMKRRGSAYFPTDPTTKAEPMSIELSETGSSKNNNNNNESGNSV